MGQLGGAAGGVGCPSWGVKEAGWANEGAGVGQSEVEWVELRWVAVLLDPRIAVTAQMSSHAVETHVSLPMSERDGGEIKGGSEMMTDRDRGQMSRWTSLHVG